MVSNEEFIELKLRHEALERLLLDHLTAHDGRTVDYDMVEDYV